MKWLPCFFLFAQLTSGTAIALEPTPKPRCSDMRQGPVNAPETDSCLSFAYPRYSRLLVGVGGATLVRGAALNLTAEVNPNFFSGTFSSGYSLSLATDFQRWLVVVPGLFVQWDLTYLFLSGLWTTAPPKTFPFRIHVGARVGMAISVSFPSEEASPHASPYLLLRPELQPFVDLEVPIDQWRIWSVIVRAAVDAPVGADSVFRWSVSAGISKGFDFD
jgi:hypothetical protein